MVLSLKEHLYSHRIYNCPHTKNTHTQELTNSSYIHREHLQKDLENSMIFPKSKRDSNNYNVQLKSHKTQNSHFLPKKCSTFT